jgi:uncharacterized membrane protein YphA (DoxX/SURF4 family)
MVLRLAAGLVLTGYSVLYLSGVLSMRPLLEAAGLPLPGVSVVVTPIFNLLAGVMLLSGAYARVGALLACESMAVAIYALAVAGTPADPPIALPIAVLAASVYIAWRGGGAWSVDGRARA